MQAIQLWQQYKKANTQLSFVNWVDLHYPEVNIKGFYTRFALMWVNSGNIVITSHLSFIVWLCRTYKSCELDFYELW